MELNAVEATAFVGNGGLGQASEWATSGKPSGPVGIESPWLIQVMLSAGSRPYISVALGGKAPLTVLEDVLKDLCGDEDAKAPRPATK